MSTLQKKCKSLVFNNNVGICQKLNSICNCYDCEYTHKCPWYSECAKQDWEKVQEADKYYLTASRKIRDTIRNRIREIPSRELYGGLLYRREESLLRALAFAHGDIVDALLVQRYLKDLPELSASDIKPSDRTIDLCNLITFRFFFDSFRGKLVNKDMNIFATREGKETLLKLIDNPLEYTTKISDQIEYIHKKPSDSDFTLTQEIKMLWSSKMFGSYNWCKSNNLPIELTRLRNDEGLEKIKNHMAEMGEKVEKDQDIVLDKKVCFDLSFNLYSSLISICRFIYTDFKPIRDALAVLRETSKPPRFAFRSLKIEDWDGLVMDAHLRGLFNDFIFEYPMPDISEWPMRISDGSLWASTLLMAFIENNYSEIALDPLKKGWVFEEKLRNELLDRDVEIIKEHLETPHGDVDFICRRSTDLHAIEAKDYGPWYKDWYISSKAFEARNAALKRRLSIFLKRVKWVNSNLERIGLSRKVEPLLVSKFHEDIGLKCLRLEGLDNFFGPSKFSKYRQTLPVYEVTPSSFNVEVMGRYVHNPQDLKSRSPSGVEMTARQCSIYPECLGIFIEDNPWLKESGKMQEFCKRLQTHSNGGPCPNFPAFCMWAGFCRSSIDPTPYVKKMREIVNSKEMNEFREG